MAEIKMKKPTGKGEPPTPAQTVQNLDRPHPDANVPFQMRVKPETKRAFQVYAANRQIRDRALFEEVWEYYKTDHG